MPEPGRITTQIIRNLKDADLVIADLTNGNPNVYYELSLRHASAKPVIHMALDGTDLPFDVIDSRTIFFHMHSRRAEAAREALRNQIQHLHPDYRPSNLITEALNVIELQSSARPLEQQVGNLAAKVEHLSANVATIQSTMQARPTGGRIVLGSPALGISSGIREFVVEPPLTLRSLPWEQGGCFYGTSGVPSEVKAPVEITRKSAE